MCKKSEKVTCTVKHIVDEMWKLWQIEGGKERGGENAHDEEETSEARLSNERHEDNNDDVEPPISVNDVEVDYEFQGVHRSGFPPFISE